MQKILRRVATAERVVAKRRKTKDLQVYRKEKKETASMNQQQLEVAQNELRGAKQAVRDDWMLGPLASRQDVGEWAEAKGAIHEARVQGSSRLTLAMRNRRCQWAGGAYNLNLVVGDRVVLIDGPDKGRIGLIKEIDHERAEVSVQDLNKSNVRIQLEIRKKTDPPALNLEIPLPISSVRLVHPIKDPETGVTRDVIINRLEHAGFLHDRVSGKKRWSRIVPGLNVAIPWPHKQEPEVKDHKVDTLRIDAEERTFMPTLLRPPMPLAVIDELRGRYSRFRTRHEPEYIERLEAEERARRDRVKLMDSMRTPLQEFHRAERANKKKKGKPRLTLEMLEKIGEVIARNRERTLNNAVSSSSPKPTPIPTATPASDPLPPSTSQSSSPSLSPPSIATATNVDVPPPAPESNQEIPPPPPPPST
ncbi:hypothetical protein F5X99DRAFT_403894 [Biscogniauxia marginata]|nr:hypothetical protein F5X99DRAFT_403894 [Biscogniauxia marginata]